MSEGESVQGTVPEVVFPTYRGAQSAEQSGKRPTKEEAARAEGEAWSERNFLVGLIRVCAGIFCCIWLFG